MILLCAFCLSIFSQSLFAFATLKDDRIRCENDIVSNHNFQNTQKWVECCVMCAIDEKCTGYGYDGKYDECLLQQIFSPGNSVRPLRAKLSHRRSGTNERFQQQPQPLRRTDETRADDPATCSVSGFQRGIVYAGHCFLVKTEAFLRPEHCCQICQKLSNCSAWTFLPVPHVLSVLRYGICLFSSDATPFPQPSFSDVIGGRKHEAVSTSKPPLSVESTTHAPTTTSTSGPEVSVDPLCINVNCQIGSVCAVIHEAARCVAPAAGPVISDLIEEKEKENRNNRPSNPADACTGVTCPDECGKCHPMRRVCFEDPCPQYVCIVNTTCDEERKCAGLSCGPYQHCKLTKFGHPSCVDKKFFDPRLPEKCRPPIDEGPCNAYFLSFGYDAELKKCREFAYGGCDGNANHFGTLAECESTCENPLETGNLQCIKKLDFKACSKNRECDLHNSECPEGLLCCENNCDFKECSEPVEA